jgi:hypothetical protein
MFIHARSVPTETEHCNSNNRWPSDEPQITKQKCSQKLNSSNTDTTPLNKPAWVIYLQANNSTHTRDPNAKRFSRNWFYWSDFPVV